MYIRRALGTPVTSHDLRRRMWPDVSFWSLAASATGQTNQLTLLGASCFFLFSLRFYLSLLFSVLRKKVPDKTSSNSITHIMQKSTVLNLRDLFYTFLFSSFRLSGLTFRVRIYMLSILRTSADARWTKAARRDSYTSSASQRMGRLRVLR